MVFKTDYCQREHAAILSTCIKLPVVINTFVLSFFERLFYTGFTVQESEDNHPLRLILALKLLYFLNYEKASLYITFSYYIWNTSEKFSKDT